MRSFALPKGRSSVSARLALLLFPWHTTADVVPLLFASCGELIPAVRFPMYRDDDDGVRFRGVTDLSQGNLSCAAREPQIPFPAYSILSFTSVGRFSCTIRTPLHRRKRVTIRENDFRGLTSSDRTLCGGNVRKLLPGNIIKESSTRRNSDSIGLENNDTVNDTVT